ncbi:MAG: hypothetical protein COY40_02385 [Alphaproteobacteria bacterium CG_4_10_14_0_8_um_filter_53_9]|nr:MAG: hypothetical protein COY40_02385 [Alphaproteobacteria bacterium CG_4_10_14_0_8_um_filter_53_9]
MIRKALKHPVFQEVSQLSLNTFGTVLISLAGSIALARGLGPEVRGMYAWMTSLAGVLAVIALIAPYNSARKLGAGGPETDWPRWLGTITTLNLVGALLTLPLLAWALTFPIGRDYPWLVIIAWLSVPAQILINTTTAFMHMRRRLWDTLLTGYIPKIMGVALVIIAWGLGALTLASAVVFNTLSAILGVLACLWFLNISPRLWHFGLLHTKGIKRFLGAGWLAGWTLFVLPKIPLLIGPYYTSLEDIGHLSIASSLYEMGMILPMLLTSVLVSHFTRAGHVPHKSKMLLASFVGMALMSIAAWVVSPYIIPWLFGAEFAPSIYLFHLYLLGWVLQGPLAVATGAVTAKGFAGLMAWPPLAGCVVCLGLCMVLMPQGGAAGGVLGVLGGTTVQLVVLGLLALRHK